MSNKSYQESLLSAHVTLDLIAAGRTYQHIRKATRDTPEQAELFVSASRECAYLARNETDRSTIWKDTYRVVSRHAEDDPALLEAKAILLKDIIVDRFSGVDISFLSRELTHLLQNLAANISDDDESTSVSSRFLVRRSSLLRIRGERFDRTDSIKKRTMDEALRCAEKALVLSPNAGAQFELALCLWATSNLASSDEAYRKTLERVENLLLAPELREFDLSSLTLARFYRMIYRPLDSCEAFEIALRSSSNYRRVLRDVSVLAEAATHLWFQEYPEHVWRYYIEFAEELTRNAIDSGYRDARNLLNLAYMHQILDDESAATSCLHEIADVPQGEIWNKLVDLSNNPEGLDEASEALCYGMTNGQTWTKLGTYVWTFYDDARTVQALYELATKLSPRDPVALTNLARFYMSADVQIDDAEIEVLLQRASSYSSRRFRWCKSLLDDLQKCNSGSARPKPLANLPVRRHELTSKLKNIKSRYTKIASLDDVQRRGYELEHLVHDLANVSFRVATPAYRFSRGKTGTTQIDGYIEHRGEKYRVECKWESVPATKDHFVKFVDALDVVGISGLFISMGGFKDPFVEHAIEYRKSHAVILFDRDDIESVIYGKVNFDELLTFKRLSFDKESKPYAKFKTYQD